MYCSEKRSGKEKIMALTLNKEYYFISKEYSNMVLNVYGTSSVANGRNVCLYEKDENGEDKMQLWKYQYDSGYGNRLHCVQNTDYVLDRSSGMTNSCANNAHTYKKDLTGAAESTVTFVAVSGETNVYRIRLTNRVNNEFLFLTAANNNGTLPASAITSSNLTTANKNVYWAAEAASGAAYRKQCWEAEEYTSGGSSGGGESGNKNYATYPCSYMKILQSPFALTSGNSNSHYYYSDASANYHDYPIDEACEDKTRSWFYCPCDEMEIKRIYGVGNSSKTNTIWLRSTSKVKMPCGEDYLVLMIMHPEDDDLKVLSVGQKFERGEKIFREGMNGNATGNHFHMSAGKGDLSSNGWRENTNGRWVLTATNGTIEPQDAFYVDKDFTTENNNGGISFTYLPE